MGQALTIVLCAGHACRRYFPTILIVLLAVFNDGAMIALSKDRVRGDWLDTFSRMASSATNFGSPGTFTPWCYVIRHVAAAAS